jgi:AcrR family transcriptional regulator
MFGKKSPEKSVTEVRLLEAAAQLFARSGLKGTTTREIALLADLNEVTLFRYFPRKSDLFLAALEFHLGRLKMSRDLQMSLAADDNAAVVIPKAIAFVLDALIAQPELQDLLHVARFELPEADKIIRDQLGPIFDALSAYFKKSADKGSLRSVEPALAVCGLIGTLTAHKKLRELFSSESCFHTDPQQAIAEYVSFCLYGLIGKQLG